MNPVEEPLFVLEDISIEVRKSDGSIQWGAEVVGRIREERKVFHLEAHRALPELQWLAVLGGYADALRADRMRDVFSGAGTRNTAS